MGLDPDTTPALELPPGIQPNFVDPPSHHQTQLIIGAICFLTCVVFTFARTYTRVAVIEKVDWTDAALCFSLALTTTLIGLAMYTGNFGQGRDQWNVTVSEMMSLLKYMNLVELIYCPAIFLAKYTVLRHIETTFFAHRSTSIAYKGLWALIWGNLFYYLAITIAFICACIPREKIWNPAVEGRCIDANAAILGSSAINVLSDLMIFVLPMLEISRLQMSKKSKTEAAGVFSIGILANVASLARLYYSVELSRTHNISLAIEPVSYWAFIEIITVFLVACLPFMPRLYRHIRKMDCAASYPLKDHSMTGISTKAGIFKARLEPFQESLDRGTV